MLRTAFLAVTVAAATARPMQGQAHTAHHHPRGAKIIMMGTLVDPLCAFAQQVSDSAQARCSHEHPGTDVQPVLLADGELYLLASRAATPRSAAPDALLGKRVKLDGTVYPAGTSYLIVVDSMRAVPR